MQQLLAAARALPGPRGLAPRLNLERVPGPSRDEAAVTQAPLSLDRAAPLPSPKAPLSSDGGAERAHLDALRAPVGRALRTLATAVEGVLAPALDRAPRAWDRADELEILDDARRAQVAAVEAQLRARLADAVPSVRAVAVEGLLTICAARALVELLEQRLPALIRLRARADERDLLPGGRPFLDLAPALAEAARGWSA